VRGDDVDGVAIWSAAAPAWARPVRAPRSETRRGWGQWARLAATDGGRLDSKVAKTTIPVGAAPRKPKLVREGRFPLSVSGNRVSGRPWGGGGGSAPVSGRVLVKRATGPVAGGSSRTVRPAVPRCSSKGRRQFKTNERRVKLVRDRRRALERQGRATRPSFPVPGCARARERGGPPLRRPALLLTASVPPALGVRAMRRSPCPGPFGPAYGGRLSRLRGRSGRRVWARKGGLHPRRRRARGGASRGGRPGGRRNVGNRSRPRRRRSVAQTLLGSSRAPSRSTHGRRDDVLGPRDQAAPRVSAVARDGSVRGCSSARSPRRAGVARVAATAIRTGWTERLRHAGVGRPDVFVPTRGTAAPAGHRGGRSSASASRVAMASTRLGLSRVLERPRRARGAPDEE